MSANAYQIAVAARNDVDALELVVDALAEESGGGLPTVYYDRVTGAVSTNSTAAGGVRVLRVAAGAELGFSVPEQPEGTSVLIRISGEINQGGIDTDGDTAYVWPVINGSETAYPRQRIGQILSYEQGGSTPLEYMVALGAGTTEVRFNWRCRLGHGIGCTPDDDNSPTWISVSGTLCQQG